MIPKLGKPEANGSVSGQSIAFESQAANITKPLASTNEMVDGGDLIIMHKLGGMIKRVSASIESDILSYIKTIEAEIIPSTRRGRASVLDVVEKDKQGSGEYGFITPLAKKKAKRPKGIRE